MIKHGQALSLLREAARRRPSLGEELVALDRACGRVVARSVQSREPLPAFDNSSMDGFAVRAADTADAPTFLPVKGSVFAGDAPVTHLDTGAWEIMTGAPMPAGCDAVVPLEVVNMMDGGHTLEILEPVHAGDYVRAKGKDFPAGATVLDPGVLVEPRHLLACAALGVAEVPVRRRPRVGIIATGRELVEQGQTPSPGQIHNSTGAYLMAALPPLGAEPVMLGSVGDEPDAFKGLVKRALGDGFDLILSTGAVSMGKRDFVALALRELGAKQLYHQVAIRPGKPGLAAVLPEGPLVFGLPGNPLSTVVGLRFFVEPVLRELLGRLEEKPRTLTLAADVPKPEGLRCFFKAVADDRRVRALAGQASFQIRPLLSCNSWLVLPEEGDLALEGASVEVYPL